MTSILTFNIMFNAMLPDLRAVENEKYRSDVVVKGLDCAIRECFDL